MKQLLILVSLIALSCLAQAQPRFSTPKTGFACACKPEEPVCASNGVTYYGECNMNCAQNWIEEKLHVVHAGKC